MVTTVALQLGPSSVHSRNVQGRNELLSVTNWKALMRNFDTGTVFIIGNVYISLGYSSTLLL